MPFGAGCPGSAGTPTLAAATGQLPHAAQFFTATVSQLPPQAPVFLLLGLSRTQYGALPLPFSLQVLGAPGCTALCSADDIVVLPSSGGSVNWQWWVPDLPGAVYFNQALVLDPSANALGLTVSNGAQGTIGP